MANLMDNTPFVNMAQPAQFQGQNLTDIIQQARQNPQAFEAFVRQTNPQAYEQAMRLRNTANPRALVTEMARSQGLAPNILRMFGL